MRSWFLGSSLLLASATNALPEISIDKRDKDTNGASKLFAKSVVGNHITKRQDSSGGTVGTNVFDVLSWSFGGAYYANRELHWHEYTVELLQLTLRSYGWHTTATSDRHPRYRFFRPLFRRILCFYLRTSSDRFEFVSRRHLRSFEIEDLQSRRPSSCIQYLFR